MTLRRCEGSRGKGWAAEGYQCCFTDAEVNTPVRPPPLPAPVPRAALSYSASAQHLAMLEVMLGSLLGDDGRLCKIDLRLDFVPRTPLANRGGRAGEYVVQYLTHRRFFSRRGNVSTQRSAGSLSTRS